MSSPGPPEMRIARWSLWALAAGLALPIGEAAAGSPSTPAKARVAAAEAKESARAFATQEGILRWMNGYRARPEPQRLPAAVQAMSALGIFKEPESAGAYVGFMAGVIGDNQLEAAELIEGMFPLPPEDQVSLIKAIAWSGLPDWRDLLGQFAERMPARKVLIDRYLTGKLKPLGDLSLDQSPAILDAHWGVYFATGRYEPILHIMRGLEWAKEDNDVEKLTIAGFAKFTLASNAARDPDLLKLLRRELVYQPKAAVPALRDVIEAAETFELAKLRREALAAIEDLKRRGPAKDRELTSWAGIGATAVAVGCVAASALGQVEIGIPCIIGGPLTQAATKYLVPQLLSKPQ